MSGVLLLLTHQFPHDSGDAAFVRNEIAALAQEFDEVRIVSFWGEGVPALPLPPNCRYLGSIGRVTAARAFRGLLSGRRLRTLWAVAARARRLGALKSADFRAMLVGMSVAQRLQQLGARHTPSETLTVYSFWGVDIAYSLPWFVREQDAVATRVHRYDLDEESEGYRPLRPAVLGVTDVLLTISDAAQSYARERYSSYISPQRILVRRLGVPGPDAPPADAPAQERVLVVSASSVIPLKRVDLILEVLADVAGRGRAVAWTHFGDGPGLAAVRSRAAELVEEVPLLDVTFPGRVPVQTILDHYARVPTTLFMNLSTIEGVPVSIMEAAAYGIPAVASDVGATREIVGSAFGSGVLVAPDATVSEIADAVVGVVEHLDRFDAHANWAERFDAYENARAAATAVADLNRD